MTVRIHRCVEALTYTAEPLGHGAVERGGDHDTGRADHDVVGDLEAVEDVADGDQQHDDRAGGQGHGQDRRPQVEAGDIRFADQ